MKLVQIYDAYFLKFEKEILIIQKKYGKYYAANNIYKKDKNCTI